MNKLVKFVKDFNFKITDVNTKCVDEIRTFLAGKIVDVQVVNNGYLLLDKIDGNNVFIPPVYVTENIYE